MTYERVQKSSSWIPKPTKKKSHFAPQPFTVQTKLGKTDKSQAPAYTPVADDWVTNNPLMRSIQTAENKEAQALQRQEESENKDDLQISTQEGVIQRQSDSDEQEDQEDRNQDHLPSPVVGRSGAAGMNFSELFAFDWSRLFHNNTNTSGQTNVANPYQGVREASEYLKQQGVPRKYRKQTLESFDIETIKVRQADPLEFGTRYFDDSGAKPKGRYLAENLPASRQSIALPPEWNKMKDLERWQIRPGSTLIEGNTAPQEVNGVRYQGGQTQKYVPNPDNDLVSHRRWRGGSAPYAALGAGGMSAWHNFNAVQNGEMSIEQAIGDTALNTGIGGASGLADDFLTPRLGGGVRGALKGGAILDAVTSAGFSAWDNAGAYERGDIGAGQATANTIVDTGVGVGSGLAGAAAGAAIGSVIPVAGTAVGAGVGFLAGMAGSYLTHELANRSGFTDWAKEGLGGWLGNYDENLAGGWDVIAGARNSISETAGNAWSGIKEGAGNAWNNASETAGNAWSGIKEGAGNAWNNASETAGNAWDAVTSWW